MPKWYDITRSDDYQSLVPEEKAQVKARFFEKKILPSLQKDDEVSDPQTIQYAYEKFMELPDDTGQGYVTSMLGAAGRGFGEMVPGAIEGVGALTGIQPLREAGQSVRSGLEEISPVNPLYGESVPVKLSQVGGQALSVLATAGAGGAIGKALGGVGAVNKGAQTAALGSAFLQGAAGGAQEAEQYGMTGPEAYLKTLAGGATEVGTELLPFGMAAETALAKRMFAGAPRTTTVAGAMGSEFGEESLGQVASNITTKALAPAGVETPGITEGALESGLYGAFGGAVIGGVNALIPTAPERQTAEQQQWQAEINATPVDVAPPITPEESQQNATEGGVPVVTPDGTVSWLPAVRQAIGVQGPQPEGMPSDVEQRLKALMDNPELEVAARNLNETKNVPFTDASGETAANIIAANAEISMQPPVQPVEEAKASSTIDPQSAIRVVHDLRSPETGLAMDLDEIELALDNADISQAKGKTIDWSRETVLSPNISTAYFPDLKGLLPTFEGRNAIRAEIDRIRQAETSPSPVLEMSENPSQTITGSNGEIAPEMPVPPQAGEAPQFPQATALKEGESILERAIINNPPRQSALIQPTTPQEDAIDQINLEESLLQEPKDRVESREVEETGVSDSVLGAEAGAEEIITPTKETPTDSLPADQPTSGDVGKRDATKPEQMTPEEVRKAAVFRKDGGWYDAKINGQTVVGGSEKYTNAQGEQSIATVGAIRWRSKKEAVAALLGMHARHLQSQANKNLPVSAAAVDTYGIKLPEGYVKQGELYVYKPEATPEAAAPSPQSLVERLNAATSRQEAEEILKPVSLADMREAAKSMGYPHKGTKKDVTRMLVSAVGSRADAIAIRQAGREQLPQTTVATNETAAPSAKGAAVAIAERQPSGGSIPEVVEESPQKTVKSTEKVLTEPLDKRADRIIAIADKAAMGSSVRAYSTATEGEEIVSTRRATEPELISILKRETGNDSALIKEIANQLGIANATIREIAKEIRQTAIESLNAKKKYNSFKQAERELKEETEQQNAQSIANLFDKQKTKPEKGAVTQADTEQAISQLQNSGEIPNAMFTWRGTVADFMRNRAMFERSFPGTVAAIANPNVEGVFENGMTFVFTDRVVITELDRRKAAQDGVTPSVAAVKRVITHENMHKGMWLLSPKDRARIMSFLRQMFPAEQRDDLAKIYSQYADWRTNPQHEMELLDELLQKYIEQTKTIPTDGVFKQFWDLLKEIWRKLTGQPKGEPTIQSMKDVVRLLRASLKNAHKTQPDLTIDGNRVLMSKGKGFSALFPRRNIDTAAAYQRAAVGKSSQWVTIKEVYEQAKADNPSLTPEAFMAQINEQNDNGEIYISPVENLKTVEAARPFVIGNAGVEMMVPSAGPMMSYASETQQASSEGQQAMRSALYTPRQLEVLIGVRQAYDRMDKSSGVAVPLAELFNKTSAIVDGLTQAEFSEIVQDLYADNAALLSEGNAEMGVSPQDAEYMAAVEAGNMETAQRMVDEAAKAAGYEAKPLWHRTWSKFTEFALGGKEPETTIWRSKEGAKRTKVGESGRAIFLSYDQQKTPAFHQWKKEGERFIKGYAKMKNPLIVDDDTRDFAIDVFAEGFKDFPLIVTEEARNSLIEAGHDSVHLYYEGRTTQDGDPDEVILLEPTQIKSADPVTYDDAGNVIPLSERFDEGADIRGKVTNKDGAPASTIVILPSGPMLSIAEPSLVTLDDAIRRIESFTEDNEDVDSWPNDVQRRFEESAYNNAIQDNDVLAAWELASDDVRDPNLEALLDIYRKGIRYGDEWQSVADELRVAGKYTIENVDAEVAKRLPQDIIDAAQEDTGELDEWVESEEVLSDAKAPFIAEVRGRMDAAIKRIEATGRYTWNGSEFEPVDDSKLPVMLSIAEPTPEDKSAAAKFKSALKKAAQGLPEFAKYEGRDLKDFQHPEHAKLPGTEYIDAASDLISGLEKEGKSLAEIFELLKRRDYLIELGVYDEATQSPLTLMALASVLNQRAYNAKQKARTPTLKAQADKLYETIASYWSGVSTTIGQSLYFHQIIQSDPRTMFAFMERKAKEKMKENADKETNQKADGAMGQMQAGVVPEVNKAADVAKQELADELADAVEEDLNTSLLREAEEGMDAKTKSKWERLKDLFRKIAYLARRKQQAASSVKASLSATDFNELDAIPLEEIDKKQAEFLAEANQILDELLGEESDAKTPEQKKTRAKRKKGADVLKKRAEKGKEIDPAIKEAAEIEIAENKASQIIYRFEELYRQGFKNPPEGMSKKEQKDSIIKAFKDQVRNPVSFEQFAERLANLKVGEEVAERMFLTASRERADLVRVKNFKIGKRKVEIADKQASRLIYATEERFRQGSKDLTKSTDGDSINKAFRDQVKEPVSQTDFAKRLAKLNVSSDVAARLFKTAAREKSDLEAMAAFDALEGPNAMNRMIRLINEMRPSKEAPLMARTQWRELFSQKGSTLAEMKKNMLAAIMGNDAFKNLDDTQKRRLSELFAEAWDKKHEEVIDRVIDQNANTLEAQEKRKAAKALRESRNQILEAVNLGIFDNDQFAKIMADKFGIKSEFTAEEKARLGELAEQLQDDSVNKAKRNKMAREFLQLLESSTNIPMAELLSNWWVASVLSGGSTIVSIALAFTNGTGIGIIGTHTARAVRLLADGKTAEALDVITSMFKAFARHLEKFPAAMNRAWQYLWTGDVSLLEAAANDPFKNIRTMADIARYQMVADQVAKDPNAVKRVMGKYMQFMARLLTALDAFNVMTTKAGTISLALRQSDLSINQIRDMELKADMKAYKQKVIREDDYFGGKAPTSAFDKAYLDSLAEAEMYKDLAELGVKVENADYLASEAAMTLNPTGVGGTIYHAIKAFDSKVNKLTSERLKDAKEQYAKEPNFGNGMDVFVWTAANLASEQGLNVFGLRFARFATNKFNQSLSYVPLLGAARLYEAENPNIGNAYEAFEDSIWRNQLFGILMVGVGAILLKAIADDPDDEDRGWFINGGWNNLTPDQKKQKLSRGEKPYTFGIGDMVFNYQNWPISQPMAAIGQLSDMIRYSPDKWKEKGVGGKAGSALIASLQASLEIPALSQIGEIFSNSMASKDPAEQAVGRLTRVMAGWAGGFVPRFLKDADYMADPTMRRYTTFFEKAASHVPIYRRYVGADYYDILGNKIEKDAYPGARDFAQRDTRPEYQMLGALNARGIWLTPANAEYRMVGKGRMRRRLTQEEADAYSLETGKLYKQMILRYGPRALQMPPERAKDYLRGKADDMRDLALQRAVRR